MVFLFALQIIFHKQNIDLVNWFSLPTKVKNIHLLEIGIGTFK